MVYQKVEGYGGRLCISRIIGSKSAGKWKNCYNLPNLFTLIKVKVIFLNLNTFYGTISSFISYILLLFSVTCGNENIFGVTNTKYCTFNRKKSYSFHK